MTLFLSPSSLCQGSAGHHVYEVVRTPSTSLVLCAIVQLSPLDRKLSEKGKWTRKVAGASFNHGRLMREEKRVIIIVEQLLALSVAQSICLEAIVLPLLGSLACENLAFAQRETIHH
jgi:hypothetical protein